MDAGDSAWSHIAGGHGRDCLADMGRTQDVVLVSGPVEMQPNPSLHPTRYSGLRPLPRAGELKR